MSQFIIRNAHPNEYKRVGELMVKAYSQLEGFPQADQIPGYYHMLANVGDLTSKPGTELLIAASDSNEIGGAVVYFRSMEHYGTSVVEQGLLGTAGFRLLAVDTAFRGLGLGRLLTLACIQKARDHGKREVIIHTTDFMKQAWKMYERIGFVRSEDLDFSQAGVNVYGLRYRIE